MSNRQGNLDHTFRLAFIRRKIRTAFKSQAVRTALLIELNTRGPDSELIVKMVERVPITRQAVVQPVQPIPQPAQPVPAQLVPAQPVPTQPASVQPAQAQPAPAADGNSEESALEVLDSEDELVQDMTLSPRREQRLSVVLLHCGCLSLNPFIEFSIQNNSSSSDVLNIQASISISPKFESK